MTDRHIGNLLVSLYAIQSAQQALTDRQSLCCVIDYHLLPIANYLAPDIEFVGFALRGSKASLRTKWRLLSALFHRLRQQRFDAVVDLYGHGESYFIAKLARSAFISAYNVRAKRRAKYHWAKSRAELPPKHQVDFYLYPFIPLLGNLNAGTIKASRQPATLSSLQNKLDDLKVLADKPLVVIHPGAGKAYKFWPSAHWRSLIAKLEQTGLQILLIGAADDRTQIDLIMQDETIAPINGFGHFNLIETIHLGFICQLMIGNDSGPTHLMATTPTTVFSLFGPTDSTLWSPLSSNSHILQSATPCLESCTKQACQRSPSCLEDLSPDYVFEKIHIINKY